MKPLLAVEGLRIRLPARAEIADEAPVDVVRGVSFVLRPGEAVALVGESGAGKSLTALALIGLLPPGITAEGRVELHGENLLNASPKRLREIRGRSIATVFQEPMTALDPAYSIGFQLAEVLRCHGRASSRRQARQGAIQLLERVAMPNPAGRLHAYPHQLSGGQRQRVVLAMALAGEPELLIADEPTTALDVTVQAEILELLSRLRRELNLCLLLITHDLGVVAQACDRAMVMYAGELVEVATVDQLFAEPAHPYTEALLTATPKLHNSPPGSDLAPEPLATIAGQVPEPDVLPAGCPFHPRCAVAIEPCSTDSPSLLSWTDSAEGSPRQVRCWLRGPLAGNGGGEESSPC